MPERRPFCSDLSRENGEPLGATASRIDRWYLIEYRGLWARDALLGSGLSDQVKSRLRDQVRAHPRSRLLFVRRPDRRGLPGLLVYVADAREGVESLRRIELADHEDLRELDLAHALVPVARIDGERDEALDTPAVRPPDEHETAVLDGANLGAQVRFDLVGETAPRERVARPEAPVLDQEPAVDAARRRSERLAVFPREVGAVRPTLRHPPPG